MKWILFFIFILPSITMAEIHKEVQICDENANTCSFWWPKLPKIKGWYQDLGHSYHYRMNTQAPENYTFANATAVIYARANEQGALLQIKTLEEFVTLSQSQFINGSSSKIKITKTQEQISKGNHKFISYSFFPSGKGSWEQVAYSQDYDKEGNKYYLTFVLSSKTKAGYDKNINSFNEFITQYK